MYRLELNGVEYDWRRDAVLKESAGATSVFSLTVLVRDGERTPEPYDTVEIFDDTTDERVFFGCIGIPDSPTFKNEFTVREYKLQVQSGNSVLRRRLVNDGFEGLSVAEIVTAIYTNYIAEEGFTLGTISDPDFIFDVYIAKYKNLGDVLDELSAPVGATWHIDAQKRFNFVVREDLEKVPASDRIGSIKLTKRGLRQRTVEVLAGCRGRTIPQSTSVLWDDRIGEITTTYEVLEVRNCTINGEAVPVGVRGEDDSGFAFLYKEGERNLVPSPTYPAPPVNGDEIFVEYIGLFEIDIVSENSLKIQELANRTGTSGKIEHVSTDVNINTVTDGTAYAEGLLDEFDIPDTTITLMTDDITNTRPLTVWDFDLPQVGAVGEYVIVDREIRIITEECPEDGGRFEIRLTLKDKDFWLKFGTVYNRYDRNIRRLSIDEGQTVLKSASGGREIVSVSEEYRQEYQFEPHPDRDLSHVDPFVYTFEGGTSGEALQEVS